MSVPASESYAHWVVASDVTAVLLVVGAFTGPGELGYASAATHLLGGPVVHVAHGEIGKGALSLGLRLGIPVTAMMVVGVLSQSPHCPADDAYENDHYCKPIVDRIVIAGARPRVPRAPESAEEGSIHARAEPRLDQSAGVVAGASGHVLTIERYEASRKPSARKRQS